MNINTFVLNQLLISNFAQISRLCALGPLCVNYAIDSSLMYHFVALFAHVIKAIVAT